MPVWRFEGSVPSQENHGFGSCEGAVDAVRRLRVLATR